MYYSIGVGKVGKADEGGMAGCWRLQRLHLQHHFWINEKQRTSNNFPSKACIVKGIVRGLNSVF